MDIRLLTAADISSAMRLKELANWNQSERDWRRLLELEPEGCFAAVCDGRLVGTATTISYGTTLAWIGMVLVDPEYRRRGMATQLMKAAIDFLRARGVATIKLDATPAGLPVYESLGFVLEHRIERQVVSVSASKNDETHFPAVMEQALALDRSAFAADRARLLQCLFDEALAQAVVVEDGHGQGYGLARRGSNAHYIGPIVAMTVSVAEEVMSSLLAQLPAGNAYLDFHTGFGDVDLHRFGFSKQRELYRMRLGMPLAAESGNKVLAIAGPEVG